MPRHRHASAPDESSPADAAGGSSGARSAEPRLAAPRLACPGDAAALAAAVQALLTELAGPGPQFSLEGARRAAERLTGDPAAGFALIVDGPTPDKPAAVATVSSVLAPRAGGTYGVLQELWVAPDRRGEGHGESLLAAIDREARDRGWPMVEVSLPPGGHPALDRLERFYATAGYSRAGMRWRRRP